MNRRLKQPIPSRRLDAYCQGFGFQYVYFLSGYGYGLDAMPSLLGEVLDYTTRFSLWQVKMRAILTQSSDLDEALDGFGKKDAKTWTDDEKRKDHTLLYGRDELTLAEIYEALQQREKMKSMVRQRVRHLKQKHCSSRQDRNRNNNYNRDKSKTDRSLKVQGMRCDEGIVRHHTIPYTPQQNGVAERMNRTIISKARCMLSNAGMHRRFWAEAASTACYLINRSPCIPLDKKTPIEVWSGSSADYSQLRVFGCTAYAHVDNGKLEPRAVKCVFLGYGSGVKAYKLWNPETKKILHIRNVVFKEAVMFHKSSSTDVSDAIDISDVSDDEQERISVQVEHVEEKENEVVENDDIVVQHSPTVLQQTNSFIAADRPRRNKDPRPRLIEESNLVHHALHCAEQVEHDTEPATYTEVVASVDRVKWISAMQEDMQSLDKNGTWDVVPLPKEKKKTEGKGSGATRRATTGRRPVLAARPRVAPALPFRLLKVFVAKPRTESHDTENRPDAAANPISGIQEIASGTLPRGIISGGLFTAMVASGVMSE
ncbi:hypothetical protein QYE76_036601 [Lolium multiflorum]|uniref:Integrase catalytic domain-containing protein n=1 Tax=Lolium multiflorum TaxID=4521 RepID=A0AAD8R576_LOLMU|nr:hypothetical protein QYE76_036601 [Lolium multiflorum]